MVNRWKWAVASPGTGQGAGAGLDERAVVRRGHRLVVCKLHPASGALDFLPRRQARAN